MNLFDCDSEYGKNIYRKIALFVIIQALSDAKGGEGQDIYVSKETEKEANYFIFNLGNDIYTQILGYSEKDLLELKSRIDVNKMPKIRFNVAQPEERKTTRHWCTNGKENRIESELPEGYNWGKVGNWKNQYGDCK